MISSRQLGERIADSRKRSGLTQAGLATQLGLARTTLVAIEKGERPPANAELVRVAEILDVALHDLLREHRPLGRVSPRFRLSGEKNREIAPAVERLRTLAQKYVELERVTETERTVARLEMLRAYQTRSESAPLDPRFLGREAASTIRGLLGLGEAPFPGLEERLEAEAGLRIFYLDGLPAKLSAFFIWGEDIGACVAINWAHPEARQRWSLAHEFAHYLRDREAGDIYDQQNPGKDASEVFADTFAAALLLPEGGLARQFHERVRANAGRFTPSDIASVARYFDMSFEATARRLEEIQLLPVGTCERLVAGRTRIGPSSEGRSPLLPPHRRLGVPQRYLALAVAALDRELISESEFAEFAATDRVSARGIREEVSGVLLEDGSALEPESLLENLRR